MMTYLLTCFPTRALFLVTLIGFVTACSDGGTPDGGTPDGRTPDGGNPEHRIPAASIALNDRGVAQMGRYEYSPAHATFAELVAQEPDWLEAKVNLAIATLNRQEDGDEERALALATEVLVSDPDQVRALYVSGIIHVYLGRPEPAAALLERALSLDQRDAYAAYFLGQSHLHMGEYEQASGFLLRAVDLDPYLRSAYWAGAQALRRLGRDAESADLLAGYERFAANPAARLAGFTYKRMGPKAEAMSSIVKDTPQSDLPAGPLFGEPQLLSDEAGGTTVTAVDVDADTWPELFITTPAGIRVLNGSETGFTVQPGELSSRVPTATIWGDIDDDGRVDLVLCDDRGARILHGNTDGWKEAQALTATPCAAGALFDADHDGDLDLFITGPEGSELHSNNRDGSFRELARDMGISGKEGRQVLVADLDADRDLDIVVVTVGGIAVWRNDRTWNYDRFAGLDDLRETALAALTTADVDADGHAEIYGVTDGGDLLAWRYDGLVWHHRVLRAAPRALSGPELSAADFDGDGLAEILLSYRDGFSILNARNDEVVLEQAVEGMTSAMPLVLSAGRGPGILTIGKSGVHLWPPGAGRYEFLAVVPSGRSEADQMRSNASGIGTHIRVRSAARWSVASVMDNHSGPGQSLMPVSIGLGGHAFADYIALEWSDGVSQTEIELEAGKLHRISETQRQLSSCPVIFAWDGTSYRFVSDVLGVGGLGFFVSPGISAPARGVERFLLGEGALVPRDGRYQIKLNEPMEENAYLDAVAIDVYDVPTGFSLVMDERMGVSGEAVTGRPIVFRRSLDPVLATDAIGKDVTAEILTADQVAPSPGPVDHRFIGLLEQDQSLTIEFSQPIDRPETVLVADGWVEYPYSQTVFAAWQAGLQYRSATLEARDGAGKWHTVVSEFGYPAGMPRKMALPVPELPTGTRALRLSSNMEIYWDRLRVVFEEPVEQMSKVSLRPASARVAKAGFAKRTTGPQRVPFYDYNDRSTYWDTKFQRGFYTALGDATPLVANVDGALAIFGGGEEIHLEFDALPRPAPGLKRHFVLDFRGWAKDMDLYTEHGGTVGPLPTGTNVDEERRELLHARYNVRFQEGL